ncbi:MAG: phosphotransferase [Clostridia bacterium]|nr:phosphotransferase [Clostridia bacterium]
MEDIVREILNASKISYNQITKATSGFTNLVYFVDDKYVIKLSKDEIVKKKLDKETSIYKNIELSCIPRFVANGNLQDFQYLIISKLAGNSLYSIWHTLSVKERQSCIKQIAQILKEFNKQDYSFLNDDYKDLNWANHIYKELNVKVEALTQMGINTVKIDSFISNDLSELFAKNNFGLVYNDAHFDNFIYDNGKLSLIDFDRVRVCPIDFEMLIFKTMCDNPSKFASEEDEYKIKEEDYIGIYNQFKTEYPEMFKDKDVEKRIAVYQFNYLIGQAIKCNDKQWITSLVNNFNFEVNKKENIKE